ncbi:MAG: glutamate 5-kinase, partial [Alcanivorax sp.]|nr:glutamate 5-kinase [Alcanivorax sp.]
RLGERVACGLVNYDAADARRLCGRKSVEIAEVLGFMNEEELIHRDNMVLFER